MCSPLLKGMAVACLWRQKANMPLLSSISECTARESLKSYGQECAPKLRGGGGRQNRSVFLCPLPAILERSTARTPQFPSGKKVTPPPPKDYVPSLL